MYQIYFYFQDEDSTKVFQFEEFIWLFKDLTVFLFLFTTRSENFYLCAKLQNLPKQLSRLFSMMHSIRILLMNVIPSIKEHHLSSSERTFSPTYFLHMFLGPSYTCKYPTYRFQGKIKYQIFWKIKVSNNHIYLGRREVSFKYSHIH